MSRFLDGHRTPEYAEHKRRYDLACLKSDLLLHLDALLDADEEVHDHFLREARAFLDEAAPGVVEELPAVDRVKWELVRAGKKQRLLDLLEFERGAARCPCAAGSAGTSTTPAWTTVPRACPGARTGCVRSSPCAARCATRAGRTAY